MYQRNCSRIRVIAMSVPAENKRRARILEAAILGTIAMIAVYAIAALLS